MIYVINTDKMAPIGKFATVKDGESAVAQARFNAYFLGKPTDLESFKITDLAKLHNNMVENERRIKKFASKDVGCQRVWAMLKEYEPKPARKQARQNATKRCKYDENMVINVVADDNPRKKKTGNGYKHWAEYKSGMTVAQLIERYKDEGRGYAGGLNHFYWDVDHGYIELKKAS